ncbi:hypothetical protein CMU94_02120 [Elizabethkingia anophelis]|nr:hypothetical protein [Elizabethkingia anophelis]
MRISELRIGNIIEVDYIAYNKISKNIKVKTSVLGINTTNNKVLVRVSSGEMKWVSIKNVNPIELTGDWLVKLGFENKHSTYSIENDKYEFSLFFYDAWNLHYEEKENYGDTEIDLCGYWNIHELQNLFFALSGEDLKIQTT